MNRYRSLTVDLTRLTQMTRLTTLTKCRSAEGLHVWRHRLLPIQLPSAIPQLRFLSAEMHSSAKTAQRNLNLEFQALVPLRGFCLPTVHLNHRVRCTIRLFYQSESCYIGSSSSISNCGGSILKIAIEPPDRFFEFQRTAVAWKQQWTNTFIH